MKEGVFIPEEYVSRETAKLLKKAGFPQYKSVTEYECCLKSTQAQAMRWLREEKDISVEPHITLEETWVGDVWEYVEVFNLYEDDEARFPTYEAAAEAGIQAACKYLVKKKE